MHLALNKIVESRFMDDLPKTAIRTDLYLYAEEAYELGHMDDAKRYYQAVRTTRYITGCYWINR